MKNLNVITVVVALSMVFSSSLALAEHGQGGFEEGGYEGVEQSEIAGELDLTAEQKSQLKEQRYQDELQKMRVRSDLKIKELELRHEIEKDEADTTKIKAVVEDIKRLQGQLLDNRVDSVLKVKGILTPEQFEKMQSVAQKHKRSRMRRYKQGQFSGKGKKGKFSGQGAGEQCLPGTE